MPPQGPDSGVHARPVALRRDARVASRPGAGADATPRFAGCRSRARGAAQAVETVPQPGSRLFTSGARAAPRPAEGAEEAPLCRRVLRFALPAEDGRALPDQTEEAAG